MTRYASRSSVQRCQVYDRLPVLAVLVHDKHTLVDVHHNTSGVNILVTQFCVSRDIVNCAVTPHACSASWLVAC